MDSTHSKWKRFDRNQFLKVDCATHHMLLILTTTSRPNHPDIECSFTLLYERMDTILLKGYLLQLNINLLFWFCNGYGNGNSCPHCSKIIHHRPDLTDSETSGAVNTRLFSFDINKNLIHFYVGIVLYCTLDRNWSRCSNAWGLSFR